MLQEKFLTDLNGMSVLNVKEAFDINNINTVEKDIELKQSKYRSGRY